MHRSMNIPSSSDDEQLSPSEREMLVQRLLSKTQTMAAVIPQGHSDQRFVQVCLTLLNHPQSELDWIEACLKNLEQRWSS